MDRYHAEALQVYSVGENEADVREGTKHGFIDVWAGEHPPATTRSFFGRRGRMFLSRSGHFGTLPCLIGPLTGVLTLQLGRRARASLHDQQVIATSPPTSLVLAHGAGSGPWIYDGWADRLPGVRVAALDLQEGVDVSRTAMADYAGRVTAAAAGLPAPVSLCGWSLGGLAVLMAAESVRPASVILIDASAPAEIQGFHPDVEPSEGTFDPEAVYGAFPPGIRARPESVLARAERKRGISVPSLPCPSLVIYGDEYRDERGMALARLYGSEERYLPGLDHWGLVFDPRVPAAIATFLSI